jgi:hypothetical protein
VSENSQTYLSPPEVEHQVHEASASPLRREGTAQPSAHFTIVVDLLLEVQGFTEVIDSGGELLETGKLVEHAPLLCNAISGNSEYRDFLNLDAAPGRLDAPEWASMRSC